MSVRLGPVRLANPVMTASGTCGYALELAEFVDLAGLGGFVTKSITLEPQEGNPPQRTQETPCGLLNSIGLANVGLDRFLEEKVPLLERLSIPVFVNVAGKTVEQYVEVARRVSRIPAVAGLELNISCPNVKEGGIAFGVHPPMVAELVQAVRRACPQTVLVVKLTPNVTDIAETAAAAVDAGADVLTVANTFLGMAIDIDGRRPVLGGISGGLSGPAIKPLALYLVHRVYRQVARDRRIPIIGLGGIMSAADAVEFMLAGATAVGIGTAALADPACLPRVVEGIRNYLLEKGIPAAADLVGALQL
ncbi:MAG: dihydroorotate dehydrogenase [Sedimentisphaerales bacterium]|nr:dihydroorotate dehydrogenase [Sedimentisphaerales bacterium]